MSRTTILLISQKPERFEELREHLVNCDVLVSQADQWQQTLAPIGTKQLQFVIVDSHDTGMLSLITCREVRALYQGLLGIFSTDCDKHLHVLALSIGVDCSFAGETSWALIAAQIKALLRRFAPLEPAAVHTFGNLAVDSSKRDAFVSGLPAQLSTIEFDILWNLAKCAGSVVSRDEIHRNLYNTPYNGYDRGIDLCISRIRQKIGDDPAMPRYLKTVRGAGYQLIAELE